MPESEFSYINHHYGLSLTRNCAVVQPSTGRRGQVVGATAGKRHYIDIRWDGCPHVERPQGCGCGKKRFAHGPFHPTHDLQYPVAAPQGGPRA